MSIHLASQQIEASEFWSDTYEGRAIAVLRRRSEYHVYLDRILQRVIFATAEDALRWLTMRIGSRHAGGE